MLDEREFELINIIGQKLGSNQRDLSRQMELSLGQTNMLIRRLVSKGYIRISQLNKRKVKYLLTPKGLSEKMQKSIKYTMNTINSIGLIKLGLREILMEFFDAGDKKFYIYGESDLVSIVESILREEEFATCHSQRISEFNEKYIDGCILICYEHVEGAWPSHYTCVYLIEELAKRGSMEGAKV